ncbi:MAG: dTDP-glucose 4,6-dehydratase [Aerococcus sp.]|nr:dTDP-glucose 4,6-dehydratase [Aerococcus sp.]
MNILVTGGAGFIGSHFVRLLMKTHPNDHIINFDALTYAGNLANVSEVAQAKNYTFVKGDIRDLAFVRRIFSTYRIDQVVNFAAESHVDRSITAPRLFMETNILGTENLLLAAKDYWKIAPQTYPNHVRFLQISTDEVYGDASGSTKPFSEQEALQPSSPYAASKASADLVVGAYQRTYQFPAMITRCTNNYGPNQYKEKFIPVIIRHALADEAVPIYGNGQQERDWIHVWDHCRAVLTVLKRGKLGSIYNVSAQHALTNFALTQQILALLGKPLDRIEHVSDRLGHDGKYAITNDRIMALGWSAQVPFDEGIKQTVRWYVDHPEYR